MDKKYLTIFVVNNSAFCSIFYSMFFIFNERLHKSKVWGIMEPKENRKTSSIVWKTLVCVFVAVGIYIAVLPMFVRAFVVPKILDRLPEMDIHGKLIDYRDELDKRKKQDRESGFKNFSNLSLTLDGMNAWLVRWDKNAYFNDSKTLNLCRAIEEQDVRKMQRLIDAGADVNVKGKDGMTLLLWSISYGKDVLECLLKNGADPNVIFESDHGQRYIVKPGETMLYSVVSYIFGRGASHNDYLDLMLNYGADPNVGAGGLLFLASSHPSKKEAFFKLLDAGADPNVFKEKGNRFLITNSLSWDKVLALLEHGATYDTETPQGNELKKLVERKLRNQNFQPGPSKENFYMVVKWLEDHDVVFDANEIEESKGK